MPFAIPKPNDNEGCYFERLPEKLVLEGFRYWNAGYATGSVTPWELAWKLYADSLGQELGRYLLSDLSHFVRTAHRCANCPFRTFPYGAHHVCRDECITLGLIAGMQHGEEAAVQACLNALTCPMKCASVAAAADSFAASLVKSELVLMPIPAAVIDDVLSRDGRGTIH